jgi:hypothetical protein
LPLLDHPIEAIGFHSSVSFDGCFAYGIGDVGVDRVFNEA